MTTNKINPGVRNRLSASGLLRAGLVSMVAAVAANLIVRAFLFALLDLPSNFPPLLPVSIIIFTLIGTGLGVLAYALVNKYSGNPNRTYIVIAAIAFIISILPNFGLMANPANAPFPGGSAQTYGVLIIFHFVTALVFVPVLLKLSRSNAEHK